MTTVTIRLYQDSDEHAVCSLWHEVFPDQPAHNVPEDDIARKRRQKDNLLFVAIRDAVLVGTAMGGYDGHRGWIYLVAVHPSCRRLGIGAQLVAAVESALRETGCQKLNLQVRAGNEVVTRFYERLGFEVEPRTSMGKLLNRD